MRKSRFEIRKAKAEDASALSAIYNQEIDERLATFNTKHVSAEEIREKIVKGGEKHPTFVATLADSNHIIVGWASISPISTRECYSGIGEVSIYVQKDHRKRGIGKALLRSLINAATQRGYWKLMGKIFVFNQASRALCKELGFRELGIHEKHGKLDDKWIDVVEVERLIPQNIT
jgi:L-amino acid N-acyltransferase YncA